jgi:hypothetical protein
MKKSIRFLVFLVFLANCRQTIQTSISPPHIPSSVSFAGEPVPLGDWDVKERLDRELIINQNHHSSTILIFKQMLRYQKSINAILKEEEVPEDFFFLAVAESALLPQSNSSKGAVGIWQFMKATAQMYDMEVSDFIDERRNLKKATIAACKYLKEAKKELGSWTMAAAAYNRGVKGMKDAVAAQKQKDYYNLYLNTETYRYVFRIIALKLILTNPRDYNFNLDDNDQYPEYKYKKIEITDNIPDLVNFAITNGTTYKELVLHNPWIRSGKYSLEITKGKTYEILIPEK